MKKFCSSVLLSLFFVQTVFSAGTREIICPKIATDPPSHVDMAKVRQTWLSWYNKARAGNGLAPYVYNSALNQTAANWSFFSKKKGRIDHKRAGQKSYYDYRKVGAWFASKGVHFSASAGRSDYVENIGWDYYSCSKADCTDDLIPAIRHTYDFFMGEKHKKYRAHYESIMNKYYREIGMGIAVDPVKKRYYLTVHYATGVILKNPAECQSGSDSVQQPSSSVLPVDLEGDHKF